MHLAKPPSIREKLLKLLALCALLGALAGCQIGQGNQSFDPTPVSDPQTPTATFTHVATWTPPPTPTPTPTSTWTPLPTATATPVPTSTATPLPTPTAAPAIPAARYHLDVALDYAGHDLHALEQIELANSSPDPWTEVVLSVPPAHWPGVFDLGEVEVRSAAGAVPLAPGWQDTMLHLPLPAPLAPGQAITLSVAFTLALPALDPAWWPPQGNVGWGERVTQVGDGYPSLVPYRSPEGWQVWTYQPVGDPTVNEVAAYDVRVTTESGVILAGAGLVSQEDGRWQFHADRARGFALLASDEYGLLEGQAGGVRVRSYYLAGYESQAQVVLDTAIEAIDLFAALYGPYPYPELVIAQNGYYGSMEYAGLISHTGYAYEHYTGKREELLVSLTAHEVAHQWWYGAVGNDQVREPWLDEALATYSEVLFYEMRYPDDLDAWWERHVDRWQPSGPLDSTIYDYADTWSYIRNVYGQGVLFMADLRALLGDESFFAFLRAYRAAGEGRLMSAADWLAVLCAQTDTDLTPLLDQYFQHPPTCAQVRERD